MILEEYLNNIENQSLSKLILDLTQEFKKVYELLKYEKAEYSNTQNKSGETQLNLDKKADEILFKFAESSEQVSSYISEEQENTINFDNEGYTIACDPIDGSSISESGLTVGSSIGIYGEKLKGSEMFGAIYALYGSNLKIGITLNEGVRIFNLNQLGNFELDSEPRLNNPNSKIASLGNFQKVDEIPAYKELSNYLEEEDFKLRYSGSFTADVHNILVHGGGLFCYPGEKLRILYECNPLGLIVKNAGGVALNSQGESILEREVLDIHETQDIFIGSKEFVEKAINFFK